jgi:Flp pilus assembly protein protease CpaA
MSGSTTWPSLLAASDLVSITAIVLCAGTAAVIDLRTRRIPNVISGGGAIAGLTLALSGAAWISTGQALAGLALGFLLLLPGHLLGATGAGDVKLFAALGSLLGPARIFDAFLFSALAGGLLAITIALQRRRLCRTLTRTVQIVTSSQDARSRIEAPDAQNRFAYAPALAAGTLLVLVIGG